MSAAAGRDRIGDGKGNDQQDIVIYTYPALTDVDPTDQFHGWETVGVLD